MTADSDFLAEHGSQLRMTLIMIEGEDGAFRLLDRWCLARSDGSQILAAAVLSTNTERRYVMLHDDAPGRGHRFLWHEATAEEVRKLSQALSASSGPGDAPVTIIR